MKYLSNIFTTGAVSQTPLRVLRYIQKQLPKSQPQHIIELGAGRGEITQKVIETYSNGSQLKFDAFEINSTFATELQSSFPGIIVHNHDAVSFPSIVKNPVDLIICSLPLSFLSKKDRTLLLQNMRNQLAPGGEIIILFHAVWLLWEFNHTFSDAKVKWFRHFPPYLLLTYSSNLPDQ
jgi:phospholipid N-methyltransferase